jgi:hypothetical protein
MKRNWRRGWVQGLIAFYWSLKKEGKRDRRDNGCRHTAVWSRGREPREGDGADRCGRRVSGREEKKRNERKGKVSRYGEELDRWAGSGKRGEQASDRKGRGEG